MKLNKAMRRRIFRIRSGVRVLDVSEADFHRARVALADRAALDGASVEYVDAAERRRLDVWSRNLTKMAAADEEEISAAIAATQRDPRWLADKYAHMNVA